MSFAEGLACITEAQEGQYEALKGATFPIGDVVTDVLRQLKIPFSVEEFNGGFDTRVCKRYFCNLPKERSGEFFYAAGVIGERYFAKFEQLVYKNRPDLVHNFSVNPYHPVVSWHPRPPQGEGNKYAFFDVCELIFNPTSKPEEKLKENVGHQVAEEAPVANRNSFKSLSSMVFSSIFGKK